MNSTASILPPDRTLAWSAADRGYRVVISVDPVLEHRMSFPCRLPVDLAAIGRELGLTEPVNPDTFVMYSYDEQGNARVFDPDRRDGDPYEIPCRYDELPQGGQVVWVAPDETHTRFCLYFDTRRDVPRHYFRDPPLIGDGHTLLRHQGPISHSYSVRVSVVDWDGDGRWDLITAGWRGDIWFWENIGSNAKPLFAPPEKLRDVDGNVMIIGQGRFLTHRGENEGGGFFVMPSPVPGWNRIAPCVVDWNDDGHPDMLIGHVDGSIYFLENVGHNRERPHRTFVNRGPIEADGAPIGGDDFAVPFVVDWNGDGVQDLLVGTYHGRVRLYRNRGTNAQPRLEDGGYLRANGEELRVNIAAGAWAGDWFGRGRLDLLVGDHEGQVYAFANLGNDENGEPILGVGEPLDYHGRVPLLGQYGYASPVAIDWDGDGRLELLVAGFEGVMFFDNIGSPGRPVLAAPVFFEARNTPITPNSHQVLPALADLNNTGTLDIITGTANGHVVWFENTGTRRWPRFQPGRKLRAGGEVIMMGGGSDGYLRGYPHPCLVDWDGDGLLDLVVATEIGWVYLFRNIGTPSEPVFAPGVRLTSAGKPINMTDRASVLVVDWTGTGTRDLLVGHSRTYSRDDVEIGRGDAYGLGHGVVLFRDIGGDTDFAPGEVIYAGGVPLSFDDRLSLAAFEDWDGDGAPDLLVNEDEKNILFYRNLAKPGEEPVFDKPVRIFPSEFSPQTSLYYSTMADLNGDGVKELVVGAGLENGHLYYYSREYFRTDAIATAAGIQSRVDAEGTSAHA